MLHNSSIRKYTEALLNVLGNLEVQYVDSNGNLHNKNVPTKFQNKEKSNEVSKYTEEQLTSGNFNILPMSILSLTAIIKKDTRIQNKNVKITSVVVDDKVKYRFNSIPYEIQYDFMVRCRGVNEAFTIIEQMATKFNPHLIIDIYDASNLTEATRIPVSLLDIGYDPEAYEDFSSNIISINFGLSVAGNLYPIIKEISRVKDLRMNLNESFENYFIRRSVISPTSKTVIQNESDYPPSIIDIEISGNNLLAIIEDKDDTAAELTYEWNVIGDVEITPNFNSATMIINTNEQFEIILRVTDRHGNYDTITKIWQN